MTIQRLDGKECTKFSDWTRKVKRLDSRKGFYATDIDLIWISKWGAGSYFLIETKCKMAEVKSTQHNTYAKIARNCLKDKDFKGLVYLQFENTGPEDGKIFWNSVEITTEQLIEYLAFEKVPPKSVRFAK